MDIINLQILEDGTALKKVKEERDDKEKRN
jgi:hypothetical protein